MAKGTERKQFKYLDIIRNSSEKKQMSYMSIFTVAISILLIAFAIRPTILTIDRINKEIKEKERIYKALEEKIEALSSLDQQYVENESSMNALELIYPTSRNFSLFLSNIDSIVARNGFVLKSVSFSEYDVDLYGVKTSVLAPWSVRISVSGQESNLVNLFRELEDMPMYPVIDRFGYGQEVRGEDRTYSISMRIYHIPMNKFYD